MRTEDFTPEEKDLLLSEAGKIEKLPELFRSILRGDKDRYFRVGDERSRNIIKGEFIRTLYFLRKFNPKPKIKVGKQDKKKFNIKRYG